MQMIKKTNSQLKFNDYFDHLLARWGVNRNGHKVDPGIYALGEPDQNSPVFVTANYTLSFDALRSALKGRDAYLLVLDTHGVNVWCAAGKGTFGTTELLHQIQETGIKKMVSHHKLILPQLGAPGIAAHEVRKQSGFVVKYGPVRAADLPEYIDNHYKASAEMRRVRFPLTDRLALVPVEMVHILLPMLFVAVILYLLGNTIAALSALATGLAGTVLFPILLPWLPTHAFSTKGFVLGVGTAIPFVLASWLSPQGMFIKMGWSIAFLLVVPAVTGYLGLNFTGSTTYTSRTSVTREMRRYIPIMAGMAISGSLILIGLLLTHFFPG